MTAGRGRGARAFVASGTLLALVLAGAPGAGPARAQGLEVYPLFVDVEAGPGGRAEVRLANRTGAPVAFAVRALRRTLAPDGTEGAPVPAPDLIVFPPQALVPQGGSQVVRLQWQGGPVARSLAHHVVFEQLPLDLGGTVGATGGQLAMLVTVLVHAYVNPPGARAEVVLEEVAFDRRTGRLAFAAVNRGRRYALLREGDLVIRCEGGAERRVEGEDLVERLPGTLVPPGGRRAYDLPVALPAGPCLSPGARFEPYAARN